MKRAMLFLIASVAIATVMAQQVPNRSFEDWSAPTFDGNIQPADWNVSNVEQFGMKFNFAHRDSGRTGYCMMVQDQDVGFAGITEIYPGYVNLGSHWLYVPSLTAVNQKVYGVSGGIDWTYRPDTMVVWIKRTGSNAANEDFHLLYYAWRGTAQGSEYKNLSGNCTQYSVTDEESDIRQALDANACTTDSYASQVAEGWFREKATYNDWTQIKVPIYYFNDSLPEKMNILLSASNYPNFRASSGFYAGNSLYVDDVELIYSSRIQKLYIDGREWTAFDPDATGVQEYELPAGTTELPTNIVAVRGAGSLTNSADSTFTFPGRTLSGNEIQITHGLLNGTPTTLTVTSEDGSSTTTYQIRFVTNDQPTTIAVSTAEELSNAFLTAASGSAIQLMSDIQMTSTLWLGTETMYEASRSLTLDLNGYSLVRTNGSGRLIDLTHGELIITSSDEQVGGMIVDQASGSSIADLIYVTGSTLKDVNPRTATNGYFSHLVIDMSVTIVAQQNAITVDRVGAATGHNIQYGTDVYNRTTSSQYMSIANGVRVDVYGIIDAQKYGVKSNGFLYAPTADGETLWTTNTGEQYADYQVEYGDTAYVPFIHIHESAMISTSSTTFGTTALYASGYARWCIEGNCMGNVGLYIKSGEAEIVNGRIESTNTDFVSVSSPQYSGISSGGSAIVIESTAIGNGQLSLIMRGDNAFISAESGYAIEEVISSSQETYVREISLYGGTLQAGEAGLIQLNTATLEAGVFYIDEENVNLIEREQESDCLDTINWEFSQEDSTLFVTDFGAICDYSVDVDAVRAPWAYLGSDIMHVVLSEGITHIGDIAFLDCQNLASMTCHAVTPPTIGSYPFAGSFGPSTPLYVPSESVSAYQADSAWSSYFSNIRAIPDTTPQPTTIAVSTADELSNAFLTAASGSTIQLINDIAMDSTLWLGTVSMGETSSDGSRLLTLDLNGHILVRANGNNRLIDLTHGELTIMSSQPGGQIDDMASSSSIKDLIYVTGSTLKDVNPMTATEGFYSRLVVSADVTISAQKNAIVIDQLGADLGHGIQYGTDVYGGSVGVANGVRLEIYGVINAQKYCIKPNGQIASPTTDGTTLRTKTTSTQYANYADYVVEATDVDYVPYIIISSPAILTSYSGESSAPALYASGYANWYIDGANCSGDIGLYVRSGELQVMGANIASIASEYIAASSRTGAGVASGGSAVVIDSYQSGMGPASLSFDQYAYISAISGYAIEEVITEDTTYSTNVTNLFLANCTLHGGNAGVIRLSNATSDESIFHLDEETVTIIDSRPDSAELSGTCGDDLTWAFNPADSTLTITGSGAMTNYSYLESAPWFGYKVDMVYVILPDGLTTIGDQAFKECSALSSITIPSSVTSIGNEAFWGCTALASITCEAVTPPMWGDDAFAEVPTTIPVYVPAASVTTYQTTSGWNLFTNIQAIPGTEPVIPEGPFMVDSIYYRVIAGETNLVEVTYESLSSSSNYLGLTHANIPDSVTYQGVTYGVVSIGTIAFHGCTNLVSITIPNSVKSIGDYAFKYCFSLTSVNIPNSVTKIGYEAFLECRSLIAITIPNSVTSIGGGAFYYCNSLTSITIPNSVTSIGGGAFIGCIALTAMIVEAGNTVYDSRDNCNAVIETATNTLIAGCQNTTIPNSVTVIGNEAFYFCSSLTSVTIPNSVTSIGDSAFCQCSSMTSVTIDNSVTSIGNYAFRSCSSLSLVTIPNGVTSIGEFAFCDCSSLTSISISNSVTSIGRDAFTGCIAVTSMIVESGNTVYDSRDNCNAIIETATNTLISGCQNTIIPNSVTSIGRFAFCYCSSLTSISIPNSVTSIGNCAFQSCSSLSSVIIPNSVTSIGGSAFNSCIRMTSITCEAITPPTLGNNAFYNVVKSTPLYVPANSIALYQAADGWQEFTNIQALHCDTMWVTDSIVTCGNEPIIWHGRMYLNAGEYVDTLQSVFGCDSICTLQLTVNPNYAFTDESEVCEGDTFQWHGRTLTKSGIYTDSLTTVDGCDSIYTLQLRVNPKYLIEDIVSVREDKLPYSWQGETITQSGDYRKEYIASTGCDSVHTLHFTVTALPIYTVNVVADHGRVNGTGTYPEGTRIYLTAVPDEGFEFQMWSDGGMTNPKEFVVTRDTTLRALFYMPEVEQEVVVDSIETNSVTITWDTVPGATLYELRIYKNGELVVTLQVDKDNNIIDASFAGPERIIARKDSTGGSSETLQVNVGGLEPGQDYTYSLDALDDDRSYVGAQSGTFTTEEEPVDRLDALFDDRRTAPRKLLRDGRLYIEMPDGRLYDARGGLIE